MIRYFVYDSSSHHCVWAYNELIKLYPLRNLVFRVAKSILVFGRFLFWSLVIMEYSKLCRFFSFTGILNATQVASRVEPSKLLLLKNYIILSALVIFAYPSSIFMFTNAKPSATIEVTYSPFSTLIIYPFAYEQRTFAIILILIQSVNSRKNVALINFLSKVQSNFVSKHPQTENIFKTFKVSYLRHFAVMWILIFAFLSLDILCLMQPTFFGVLSYLLFNVSYLISVAFLTYFYFYVQFINAAQKALSECVRNFQQNFLDDWEICLKDILNLLCCIPSRRSFYHFWAFKYFYFYSILQAKLFLRWDKLVKYKNKFKFDFSCSSDILRDCFAIQLHRQAIAKLLATFNNSCFRDSTHSLSGLFHQRTSIKDKSKWNWNAPYSQWFEHFEKTANTIDHPDS